MPVALISDVCGPCVRQRAFLVGRQPGQLLTPEADGVLLPTLTAGRGGSSHE